MKNYEEKIQEWEEIVHIIDEGGDELGLYPSPPDPRDYTIDDIPLTAMSLPDTLMLTPSPIVLDQQRTSYCAGASGAGVTNAYYNNLNLMPQTGFSMSFLYWLCKEYDGIPDKKGTYIRTLLKIMKKYGVASEALAPFSENRISISPSALREAEEYKIESYARLNSLSDIKEALYKGMYIIIGTIVTRENWNRTFLGQPSGSLYGGHATHLFGYDDLLIEPNKSEPKGYFYGQNSWGERYHAKGRFYLPYDYYTSYIHQGRKAFMEAWGVKFYDLDEEGNKKENKRDSLLPVFPKFDRDSFNITFERLQEYFERLRRLLER